MLSELEYNELLNKLEDNVLEAERLRDFISENDKNLFNDQKVIDWQDRLNEVSITRECDLIS